MKKLLILIMLIGSTSLYGQNQSKEQKRKPPVSKQQQIYDDSIKQVIGNKVDELLEKELVGKPIYGTKQPIEKTDSTIILLNKLKLEQQDWQTHLEHRYNIMKENHSSLTKKKYLSLTKEEQIQLLADIIKTLKDYEYIIDLLVSHRKDLLYYEGR
jgi:hypothetical protein